MFSYGVGRWYCVHRFTTFPFCCGCKPKSRRDDRLFADAKQKLYEEIDLLEIVKKLRVNQFASDVVLKPRQRDLVNLFLTYKLKGDKEPEELVNDTMIDSNAYEKRLSRQKSSNLGGLGKEAPNPFNVDDLLDSKQSRMFKALETVSPEQDKVDKLTFKRIVPQRN